MTFCIFLFTLLWFPSSYASFFALLLHCKKELGKSYEGHVQEFQCFVFALFLGPLPLVALFVIHCFKLYKD